MNWLHATKVVNIPIDITIQYLQLKPPQIMNPMNLICCSYGINADTSKSQPQFRVNCSLDLPIIVFNFKFNAATLLLSPNPFSSLSLRILLLSKSKSLSCPIPSPLCFCWHFQRRKEFFRNLEYLKVPILNSTSHWRQQSNKQHL